MNETERKAYLEQFNRRTHVLGRIVSAITLVLLVGALSFFPALALGPIAEFVG